jgi:sulfide:quinone oxidoreductase
MTAEYFAMRVLQLEPDVYVTGQLFERELDAAARQGVRTIVNNRPDDEAAGQPKSADLQRAAEALGMTFVYFPVVSGRITGDNVDGFRALREDLERPMLIFCRTGARSTQLWELCDSADGG